MTATIDCPNVFEAGLPTIDYGSAQHPDEAHAIIRQAREKAPIAIGPYGPELLTYDLVRTALRDPRFRVPQGMFLAAQGITDGPVWDRVATLIISLDGAAHHRLRRLVSKAFMPKAATRLRATMIDVITGLVDRHSARGHCDVVNDIARQYPIPVICALLGAPPEDWELFSDWTDDILKAFGWNVANDTPTILTAWDALDTYVDDMLARRRHALTDDLISELIRAEDDGDRLSVDELRMLVISLLMAGTDTTRHQLGAAVHMLCDHPDQWALLGREPELAGNAVEELIRHSPLTFVTLRVALETVALGGVQIPAGTIVVVNTGAANRDPSVYDDPDRLDITRVGAPPIQTFGSGVHYCLGANLARLELAEALTVMTRRMPTARRTGPAPWGPVNTLGGPITLPIAFEPNVFV
ncbi:cytochrome P450 [Mycobacterium intermedium]|uniref:Cytochrome P450 n=1 Tax=Mycobacterium intermedium TaxID=28445 RepID=A0A1E3S742_MYCIE|nr:cytochrome P450 [Mycobacterium intermedium]MCV6966129.1 cytochrome P450 [Mycobacterium intermedium]ODQ97949.1 cytochrome [Mycobacterium intermedium]OPE48181.1 cytochrome P450 [Mycobacterium intermedium]ORA99146.1 cytochrome P450 [Mycobacterium intermedium]